MSQDNKDIRYSIGIDLGTTHSALACVDLAASDGEKTVHQVLAVPQVMKSIRVETFGQTYPFEQM